MSQTMELRPTQMAAMAALLRSGDAGSAVRSEQPPLKEQLFEVLRFLKHNGKDANLPTLTESVAARLSPTWSDIDMRDAATRNQFMKPLVDFMEDMKLLEKLQTGGEKRKRNSYTIHPDHASKTEAELKELVEQMRLSKNMMQKGMNWVRFGARKRARSGKEGRAAEPLEEEQHAEQPAEPAAQPAAEDPANATQPQAIRAEDIINALKQGGARSVIVALF